MYRALELLEDMGLVEVEVGEGVARYEPADPVATITTTWCATGAGT